MSRLPTVQNRPSTKQVVAPVEPDSTNEPVEEKQPEATATTLPPIEFNSISCDFSFAMDACNDFARRNLTIRLTSRQAIAMRLLVMGFEREIGSIYGRRPNEQDWLRHLLDKVAEAAGIESYESNNH